MYKSDVEAADAFLEKFKILKTEISKVIVGQEEVIDQIGDFQNIFSFSNS